MTEQNISWNEKPTNVILLLIFFFPIGIYFMWKNGVFSKSIRIILSFIFGLILLNSVSNSDSSSTTSSTSSSTTSPIDTDFLIGNTYSLDTYHQLQFKSSTRYWIYQKPLNCGGDGNWSIKNGKIVLGPNDSKCSSTNEMKGEYNLSKFE